MSEQPSKEPSGRIGASISAARRSASGYIAIHCDFLVFDRIGTAGKEDWVPA